MPKTEVDELTEKTIAKGGILAKLYFDMQSKNEEELQPLMADLINNRLLKSVGVLYCTGAIDEPIKLAKENVYSTNAAVTVLFNDIGAIVNAVFNFAPAGVEVLKPQGDFRIKHGDFQSLLLDLSEISVSYSKYILERVLSKEDFEKVNLDMKLRSELGRKLIGNEAEPKSAAR
ncbi:MAG: hypothetical protein M1321_01000 [Candidatus Marsarchaeota archaeon]|nr:hypothetical protein [Candidatus Marsarchaeota archaeon]